MELTLDQTVTLIQAFATQHLQIKDFFFGDIWEYTVKKGDKFPVLTCTLKGANLSDGVEVTDFEFGIWDLVNIDNSNELAVLSDTKSIAKDLVSYFRSPLFEDFEVNLPVQMTDYNEKFDHACSGWFFTVSFKQAFQIDLCAIPSSGLPAYQNLNVVTIYDSLGNIVAILSGGQTYTLAAMATDTADTNTNLSGTTFTLTHIPVFITGVFLNGQRLTLTTDYTVSGTTITFNNALANDIVVVVYSY